ncbi:hypothetical protein EGH21_08855 [Halomicroarcula sp. F13]|uniref:DUF7344 domain-containing protein n=1 Tax=Haloarcula rubra TaxID=2487747 RepID=A0AAW4PRF6_9EURY|nr:hypothetical protein [Halomicroarcula rubra]MBX0323135.1 hypothetical protein [Halomicroarcula rubra]
MRDKQNGHHDADSKDADTVDTGVVRTLCGDPAGSRGEDALDDGAIFDVLRNERRRATLSVLPPDESVSVSSLAEQVAAIENDTTPESLTERQRKRVYVSLHQSHLPKMDDLGIVAFDREAATVSLGPAGDDVGRYVDGVATSRAWYRYYAAIALAGLGLLLAQTALLPAASTTPVAVVVLLAVGACSALHWVCER